MIDGIYNLRDAVPAYLAEIITEICLLLVDLQQILAEDFLRQIAFDSFNTFLRQVRLSRLNLANDYSFSPILAIISEPIFREEDKQRIIAEILDLEYAKPPRIIFTADQYEINQAVLSEEEDITLLLGSSNEREVGLKKDIQFLLTSFPMSERLLLNRAYAGYRGSLTFTEDLYDNL